MPMTMKVVLVGREQRAPVASERDQHVGRQRRDLEEDEDVERVAGDRDAQQPGQGQQEHRVEEVLLRGRDLVGDRAPRIRQHDRGDAGHQHEHERRQAVDAVFDPPRRRPAADRIRQRALLVDLHPQRDRGIGGEPARRQRDRERGVAPAQQYRQRRGQQRDDDLQCGQVFGKRHSSTLPFAGASRATISSSSIVP
jgi:hypothetical protein